MPISLKSVKHEAGKNFRNDKNDLKNIIDFFLEMVRFFHLLTCQLLRQVTFVLLRQKK